jgi:hypothetical protein
LAVTHGSSPEDDLVRLSQSASDKKADTATTGMSIASGEVNAGAAFCRRSLEILSPAQALAPGAARRLFSARRGGIADSAVAWLHRLRRRHAAPDREYRRSAGVGARSGRADSGGEGGSHPADPGQAGARSVPGMRPACPLRAGPLIGATLPTSTAAEVRAGVAASPLKQGGASRTGVDSSPWIPGVRDASRCLQAVYTREKQLLL